MITSFQVAEPALNLGRLLLRAPVVQARLLIDTPAAWPVFAGASLLILLAWQIDRRGAVDRRWILCAEGAAGLWGAAVLAWFIHWGNVPWTEGDWREEWKFFFAWKEALAHGAIPYYLSAASQGTEQYLGNVQTPLVPWVIAMRSIDLPGFFGPVVTGEWRQSAG